MKVIVYARRLSDSVLKYLNILTSSLIAAEATIYLPSVKYR